MKQLILGLLCITLFTQVWASKTVSTEVRLLSVKALQSSEVGGDELYMAITQYPSGGKASHRQIPKAPKHWLSKHLDSIHNITVWGETLQEGQAVTLLIALIEKDTPPWNTDDLIGEVRLHLKNENGQLKSNWSMPNRTDAPVTISTRNGQAMQFEFFGEGARYLIYFDMKTQ